jgi:hypothetical protein
MQGFILRLKAALKEAREDLRLYAILPGYQGEIAANAVKRIDKVLRGKKNE